MDISRKKPILKNRVPEYVEEAVVELAIDNPALGQKRVFWKLQQKRIMVSSSSVRSVLVAQRTGDHEKASQSTGGPLGSGKASC